MAQAVLCAVDRPREASGQIYNCGDEIQLTLRQLADVVASAVGHRWDIVSLPSALAVPSWPMIYTDPQGSWHQLYDTEKLRRELSYRDVVPAVAAMTATVRWYVDHRDKLAAGIEERLGDPFDYPAEDRLAAEWHQLSHALMARHGREDIRRPHPYPHPKQPSLGQDHRGR
jgi:hypothetical protein